MILSLIWKAVKIMSRIEELIKAKCPDGVEYKQIMSIAQVSIGEFVHKNNQSDEAPYPVYNGGTTNTGFYEKYNRTENKIIISARGANAGYVNRVFTKYWSGNSCYTIDVQDETVDWSYVYYYLKNNEIQLVGAQQNGGIPAVSKRRVEEFEIPVPPFEVQQEIVSVLDKFVELKSVLKAELEVRKKQYEHYREELLNFDDNIEYCSLGDSCYIKARIGWQKLNKSEYLSEGDYLLVTGVNITKTNRVNFDTCYYVSKERYDMDANIQLQNGDIIITKDGTIGKVALIEGMEKPAVLNSHLFVIRDITGKLNHKFLLYVFLSNYFTRFVEGNKTSGTIAGLNQATMVKFMIPFPTLNEQERIVHMLDKFLQLIKGLTDELEVRHKQYEYYRDKLLTFERKVV